MTSNHRPLTVTVDEHRGRLVRDCAQAQGVTYRSLLHAMIDTCLEAGRRPFIREPWGEPDAAGSEGATCATDGEQ